nr:hypothetical protein CFP56_36203 [Quercus suber]
MSRCVIREREVGVLTAGKVAWSQNVPSVLIWTSGWSVCRKLIRDRSQIFGLHGYGHQRGHLQHAQTRTLMTIFLTRGTSIISALSPSYCGKRFGRSSATDADSFHSVRPTRRIVASGQGSCTYARTARAVLHSSSNMICSWRPDDFLLLFLFRYRPTLV